MNQRLQVSQTSKDPGSKICTVVAYTFFPNGDCQDGHNAQQEAKTELKRELSTEEKSYLADPSDKQEWLVTLPESVKLTPRAKQMFIGRMEVPKRGSESPLVCIETAQPPSEDILVTRGVSSVIVPTQQSKQPCVQTAEAAQTASYTSQGND
jgi:hypothetical protein